MREGGRAGGGGGCVGGWRLVHCDCLICLAGVLVFCHLWFLSFCLFVCCFAIEGEGGWGVSEGGRKGRGGGGCVGGWRLVHS